MSDCDIDELYQKSLGNKLMNAHFFDDAFKEMYSLANSNQRFDKARLLDFWSMYEPLGMLEITLVDMEVVARKLKDKQIPVVVLDFKFDSIKKTKTLTFKFEKSFIPMVYLDFDGKLLCGAIGNAVFQVISKFVFTYCSVAIIQFYVRLNNAFVMVLTTLPKLLPPKIGLDTYTRSKL